MSTIITIASAKGGAGKSTLAAMLAAEWTVRGLKVVCLDADPQGSLVSWSERRLAHGHESPMVVGVGDAVGAIATQHAEHYDVVVIDTPGHTSDRTMVAMGVADVIVIPAQGHGPAAWALEDTLTTVATARRINEAHGIEPAQVGIVANMVRRTKLHQAGVNDLAEKDDCTPLGTVRLAADIDSAMSRGLGCPQTSTAVLDIRAVADNIDHLAGGRGIANVG